MEMILNYVIGILLCSVIPILVVLNIARFIMWIKCFKIKECSNRKCRYHVCCRKYKDEYEERQTEDLYLLIKKYKKELKDK